MTYPHIANIKKYLYSTILFVGAICSFHDTNAQSNPADTVAIANKLVADKKIYQANKLLNGYVARHPKAFDAVWLNAQTNTWLTNYTQADTLYKIALKIQPKNGAVQMDYIRMLLYMGKFSMAEKLLDSLDGSGSGNTGFSVLRARMHFWAGAPDKALAILGKVLEADAGNTEANEMLEEIRQARALRVSLNGSYLLDNQPYEAYYSNLKVEQYRNKYLDLYLVASQYNFVQPNTTDAQWATLNNKMFFPAAKLHINYGGGMVKFPTTGYTDWTANVGLVEQFAPHFNLELNGERSPYLDTRRSIDSSLSVTRFSGKLNFQKREWSAQLTYLNSSFKDNNTINTAYAWLMVPVWISQISKLHLGYSIAYANADKNSYRPSKTLSQVLSEYNSSYKIAGMYDPYFTPSEMLSNSLLFSFNLDITKAVSFSLSGDVGTATTSNPYLSLARDSAGPVHITTAFLPDHFNPYSISTGINIHPGAMWQVTARYSYKSTYFFTSNYVSVGIEKGFGRSKKRMLKTKDMGGDAFGARIKEIEQRLKALRSITDADKLEQELAKIKADLETLKAEQERRLSMTEITPESDEATVLQDRKESIDEMLKEIDAANAGQSETDRAQQLSWVIYRGNSGSEGAR